ncbi:MAG: aldo/keto reductase [Planctomycetes bacterium]|jgi:aryl-alcohol dehydrogenase-like predicted oxidoreductase|nr:aldo/keto reductase [Planctomycetota bacterium]
MKYRRLGQTGLRVSVIGVGTWQYGGEWGKDFTTAEVDAILAKAAELGINLIDTAECYGDHLAERLIGPAIKGRREKWIIATKFGHRFNGPFQRDDLFEPAQVEEQLERSLAALQTDYIDLYQFHSGTDGMFDTPGLWEKLSSFVASGKVRHLGISISKTRASVYQADQASDVGAEAVQVVYNRIECQTEKEILPACLRQGLGVLARVPLASGFLSGKYTRQSRFSATDVRAVWQSEEERLHMLEQVERIKGEVPEGVPMAQWALAWCLQHPAVSCVIPGSKSVAQVEANAQAADLPSVADRHPLAAG